MGVGVGDQLVLGYTDCFGDGIGACGLLDWGCGARALGLGLKVSRVSGSDLPLLDGDGEGGEASPKGMLGLHRVTLLVTGQSGAVGRRCPLRATCRQWPQSSMLIQPRPL